MGIAVVIIFPAILVIGHAEELHGYFMPITDKHKF